MTSKNKNDLMQIKSIYRKILRICPFLTKKEKNVFEKKSKNILDRFAKNNITSKDSIEKILSFLETNGHADIREYHKINRDFIRRVKPKKMPFLKIENRILNIKIPSWAMWLGKIDKKLNGFCQKNINKYDGIIIDVRENQGGSSKTAHDFASIFFKKQIIFGKFIKKLKNGKLKTVTGKLKPSKNIFIDKPIMILISRKCFSSNELFLAPFKISKRAVLIGESTRGGSANSISETIELSGKKFIVRIPTWRFFLKGKKRPIEKTKIHPDVFYKGKNIEKFVKRYLLKELKNN